MQKTRKQWREKNRIKYPNSWIEHTVVNVSSFQLYNFNAVPNEFSASSFDDTEKLIFRDI